MNVGNITVKWSYDEVDAIIDSSLVSIETECSILKNDEFVSYGIALCSPNDTYDKEFGRKLSMSRALLKSDLTKEERSVVWEAYRTMTKTPRW
jgi:hypothetical protein